MLPQPKPYNGIHPKIVVDSILKNGYMLNSRPASIINIPNRDLQSYDSLIPAALITIIPALQSAGGLVWR